MPDLLAACLDFTVDVREGAILCGWDVVVLRVRDGDKSKNVEIEKLYGERALAGGLQAGLGFPDMARFTRALEVFKCTRGIATIRIKVKRVLAGTCIQFSHLCISYVLYATFVFNRPISQHYSYTPPHQTHNFILSSNSPHVLNVPFVLGISPSRPATLLVAILIATANALNALSARW